MLFLLLLVLHLLQVILLFLYIKYIVLKRSALVYFIQNIPIILPVIILMMAFFFYT